MIITLRLTAGTLIWKNHLHALPGALPGFGNIYAKLLLGLGVEDSTARYRVYAASLLRRLDLDRVRRDSYGFQIEMTYLTRRAGAGIVEVPIHFVDRVAGTSKMSTFTVAEAFTLVTGWGLRRMLWPRKGASART